MKFHEAAEFLESETLRYQLVLSPDTPESDECQKREYEVELEKFERTKGIPPSKLVK